MADIIQMRRDTATSFIAVNPILHQGEVAFELDTGFSKIGDGITAWNSLEYSVFGRAATTSKIGLMSSSDKTKLDGIVLSQTPAADKVPQANASGIVDLGWLDPSVARSLQLLAVGVNPSLDLNFWTQLYSKYGTAKGLDALADPFASFITFTRASVATYFGPDGTLRTAASGEPRIDYDPATGECLGFLVEGARTNWVLNSDAPVTQNIIVSAQTFTLSFYGTGSIVLSGAYNGTIGGSGAFPVRSALTFASPAGTITLTVSGSVQYAQFEAGAFASSYIPVTSAAVTRAADTAVITGTNFSSWYNPVASSCLLVLDASVDKQSAGVSFYSSSSSRLTVTMNGSTAFNTRLYIVNGGVTQANIGQSGFIANSRMAVAASWAENDCAVASNAGSAITDTSVSLPSVSALSIGDQQGTGAHALYGHIRSFLYWPRRLTNAQLRGLTK